MFIFFFSSRRRHTRSKRDWSSDVCSSDLLSRANRKIAYPANFQLIAAMNPCPCGWLGYPEKSCGHMCGKAQRYQQKISGPLLDRIDLHVSVTPAAPQELFAAAPAESSASVRKR